MTRISKYTEVSTPVVDDLLLGTDVTDNDSTKNFTIQSIVDLIEVNTNPNLQAVTNAGATTTNQVSINTSLANVTALNLNSNNSAVLGIEILTTASVSTGWTGSSFTTGYTHTSGNTSVLQTTNAISIGSLYKISYIITSRTTGNVTISVGGQSVSGVFATGAFGPKATSTSPLTITPSSTFNGNIVVSLKLINQSSPAVSFGNGNNSGLLEIKTSFGNVIYGTAAGIYNTGGYDNSFIGYYSGTFNTTGNGNSFIGSYSGTNNTTGYNNSFLGASSGSNNISGYNNSCVGYYSGANSTTGYSNSFLGYNSGVNSTTGVDNTFIGSEAGSANITGNANISIGSLSNVLNSTNTNSIVIGFGSIGLGSNTTVLGNVDTVTTAVYGSTIIGGTLVNSSAQFQVDSTTKGVLLPRLTTAQVNGIVSPLKGLTVFNTDLNTLCFYTTSWQKVTSSAM